jgi:penicillin-binding protein 1A
MGYTPELVVGIYIGNDNRKPVGISGTEVSALWGTMMSKVVSDSRAIDFSVPPNVITKLAICAESGKLAPSSGCSDIEYSAFIRGTEPKVTDSRTRGGQSAPSNNQRDNRPFWKLPWRLPGF